MTPSNCSVYAVTAEAVLACLQQQLMRLRAMLIMKQRKELRMGRVRRKEEEEA